MKKSILSVLSFLAITLLTSSLVSCSGKSASQEDNYYNDGPERPEDNTEVLYSLNPFHVSDSITWGGHRYTYTIDRQPLDSAVVIDDEGLRSQDNTITLTINRDGAHFFQQRFTRSAFHIHIDENYYKQCVLLGMNFDRTTEYGLRFQASIGKGADSEDYKPYSITVGTDGSTNITEHDLYDDDEVTRFEDEGV